MCNREVKFGAFFDFAKKHGAESIATGHYAQSKDGVLLRGHDAAKDQSYFLWAVPKKVLREVIFPIGEYSKTKVRSLARTFTLPVSEKKDSQGICFLGDVSIEDFLKAECGHEPGRALDESGLEIGSHEGAVLYTLGERVHLESAPSGPWYVHAKNIKTNEITVGKERSILRTSDEGVSVTHPNAFQELSNATEAQSRYHGELISGRFDSVSNIFVLEAPTLEPLTSGQSLVLYKGKECVGGGIISS
jgi:tRNA-specific 2-thiouridylase